MEDYNKFSIKVSRYEAEISDWERECRERESVKRYSEDQNIERSEKVQYHHARIKTK